jgi:hypothetical protein
MLRVLFSQGLFSAWVNGRSRAPRETILKDGKNILSMIHRLKVSQLFHSPKETLSYSRVVGRIFGGVVGGVCRLSATNMLSIPLCLMLLTNS